MAWCTHDSYTLVRSVSYTFCFQKALKKLVKFFHVSFQRVFKTQMIAHTRHKQNMFFVSLFKDHF